MKVSQVTRAGVMPAYFVYSKQHQTFEGRLTPGSARKARKIQAELSKQGITSNFEKNGYLAGCVKRVSDIYKELFGEWSLPKNIDFYVFTNLSELGASAYFRSSEDKIAFNRSELQYSNRLFQSIKSRSAWRPRFNTSASLHRAQVYVHEFAHCAHFHNIKRKHNHDYAIEMMNVLRNKKLHEPVGILITKFQLGRYSLTNMNEFMAERITQDICDCLQGSDWQFKNGKPDTGYSNIFSRKWHNKFEDPQAYLDYYTEQVWDGDMKNADEAAEKIRKFLELLEEGVPVAQAIRIRDNLMPLELKKDSLKEEIRLLEVQLIAIKEKLKSAEIILSSHPNRQSALKNAIDASAELMQISNDLHSLQAQRLSIFNNMVEKSEIQRLVDEAREQLDSQEKETEKSSKIYQEYKDLKKNYEQRLENAIRIEQERIEATRRNARMREAAARREASRARQESSGYYCNSYQETSKVTKTVKETQTETVTQAQTYSSAQKVEQPETESLFKRLGRAVKDAIDFISERDIITTKNEWREREKIKLKY